MKNSLKTTLHTDGKGCWSNTSTAVKIKSIKLRVMTAFGCRKWGELKIFFTKESWDCSMHGLIYTDNLFLKELNSYLKTLGLPKVYYSEQGMQRQDYVSLDAGPKFCKLFSEKYPNLTEIDNLDD